MSESSEPSSQQPSQQSFRRETWFRLLFVLLFVLILGVAKVVLVIVIAIQFGFVLSTAERNQKLLEFSARLNQYIYQIIQFMTFNAEQKPFPFADWPPAQDDA